MTAAQVKGGGHLEAYDLEVGQHVDVHLPGMTAGQLLSGLVSTRSTHLVLVLERGGGSDIVDRIPWSAVWLIRTREETSS